MRRQQQPAASNQFSNLIQLPFLFAVFVSRKCIASIQLTIALLRLLPVLFFYQQKITSGIYFYSYEDVVTTLNNDLISNKSPMILLGDDFVSNDTVCVTKSGNGIYHLFTQDEAEKLLATRYKKHPFTFEKLSFVSNLQGDNKTISGEATYKTVWRMGVGTKMAVAAGITYLLYSLYDYYSAERLPDGTRLPNSIAFDELKAVCNKLDVNQLK